MLSRVQEARRHVDALRNALLSPTPEPIEQSLPILEEAAVCLRGLRAELDAVPAAPHLRRRLNQELRALRLELSLAGRLAAEGARFHEGWARLVGAFASGYTRDGEAAALAPASTLTVEA